MDASTFNTIYSEEVYSVSTPVTVVIDAPWSELKEDDRQLLSKILQAVRLSVESVRIVHLPSFDLSTWNEKPTRMIAFVNPPKGLNQYELIQTGNTSVIFSEPLDILALDQPAKVKLWGHSKNTVPGLKVGWSPKRSFLVIFCLLLSLRPRRFGRN